MSEKLIPRFGNNPYMGVIAKLDRIEHQLTKTNHDEDMKNFHILYYTDASIDSGICKTDPKS
jgi:hypothetical protein